MKITRGRLKRLIRESLLLENDIDKSNYKTMIRNSSINQILKIGDGSEFKKTSEGWMSVSLYPKRAIINIASDKEAMEKALDVQEGETTIDLRSICIQKYVPGKDPIVMIRAPYSESMEQGYPVGFYEAGVSSDKDIIKNVEAHLDNGVTVTLR